MNTSLFDDVQQYPQDVLDQKSQQCITFFMVAAFCAWDGGRMPTIAELDYAWDSGDPTTHLYPWGNTPVPGGWDKPYPFDPTGKGFGTALPAGCEGGGLLREGFFTRPYIAPWLSTANAKRPGSWPTTPRKPAEGAEPSSSGPAAESCRRGRRRRRSCT